MPISPAQCRAARALLGWTRERLAVEAGRGYRCVSNFEAEARDIRPETLTALTAALEAGGVAFVEENVDGPGVRIRKVR